MAKIKLFSNFFNKKIKEDEMFNNQTLVASYLVGAFASAIVEASWDGIRDKERGLISYVKENETYKKWLSNQQITYKNLVKIFNKGAYYQRKFNLDSPTIKELSTLVTDNLKLNKRALDQEVSFAFLRGYNDYRKFKYTKGENSEPSKTE